MLCYVMFSLFTNVTSALEVFLNVMRYINPRFTYLLTYLLTHSAYPVIFKTMLVGEARWEIRP